MIDTRHGTLEVENPAETLRDEDGLFEVTSPYGHVFQVTCRRGVRMNVREISEPKYAAVPDQVRWRIRRISDNVA
jgi:hypothetical protein